jgi:hypothetical protein
LGKDFLVVEITVVTVGEGRLFYDQGIFDIFPTHKLSGLTPLTCRARTVALLRLAVALWLFALVVGALMRSDGAVGLMVAVDRLIKYEVVKFLMTCIPTSTVGALAGDGGVVF